jgi:hypothetical protein
MSKILVNYNLQSGKWTIEEEDIRSFFTDVKFYFSDSEPVAIFNNLYFGIKLKKDAEELFSESFGTNKKYVASENTLFDNWIEHSRLSLDPNTFYTLELWCENNNVRRTHRHEFTTPDIV